MERRRVRPGGQRADFLRRAPAGCLPFESAHSPSTLAAHRPARGECSMRAFVIVAAASLWPAVVPAADKLTMEDRIELTRGLTAEYASVKVLLPRSKSALEFNAD